MARIEIAKGPSPWHLMLGLFDPHGSGGGTRAVDFTLESGYRLSLEVLGVQRPNREHLLDPWVITGESRGLPKGYYYFDGLEVHWDPFSRKGWVNLQLTSPCCGAEISSSLADGTPVGSCSACHKLVVRVNRRTSLQEWIDDGTSPWSDRDDLPLVQVLSS